MNTDQDSILVVAIDGLDKELLEKFDCSTFTEMTEFNGIDNSTGIDHISTGRLFTSFITGELPETHGVKNLRKFSDPRVEKLDSALSKLPFIGKMHELRQGVFESINSLDVVKRTVRKEDINQDVDTVFDKVDNSKSLFVPGYNPSAFSDLFVDFAERTGNLYIEDWDDWEFPRRKKHLFKEVNKYFDFLIVHFHRIDHYQHCYGDKVIGNYDEEVLREKYSETEELAEQVIDYFEGSFDCIVFMSDHGRPVKTEHNENAFYSCNQELFDEEPHITDFYNCFLEVMQVEDL